MTDTPPEKPKRGRATKAEAQARVEVIFPLVVGGARRIEILQYVTNQTEWGLSVRQIDNYIAKCNDLMETESQTVRQREIGRSLRRLHGLYRKALVVRDMKTALAVQREINALLGLYPDTDDKDVGTTIIVFPIQPPTAEIVVGGRARTVGQGPKAVEEVSPGIDLSVLTPEDLADEDDGADGPNSDADGKAQARSEGSDADERPPRRQTITPTVPDLAIGSK